jgi:HSP20 family protein
MTMFATRTPLNPLAQTLDRMSVLNRALGEVLPEAMRGASPVWVPALEVAERGDAYMIAVDLPGVREGDLELSFENNVLTLRGSKTASFAGQNENDLRVHISERQTGSFERSVRLPEFVEGDKIEAHFTDGVLYVTVPKSRAAQPRRIPVNGAGASNGTAPQSGEVSQDNRGN